MEPRLTGAVIARDDRAVIGGCVESLSFCDEVLVLDGGSRDGTAEVAAAAGARVERRDFDDFARQRNAALDLARGEWVLFVDADERVPRPLAEEVRALVGAAAPPSADAFLVPRRAWILGRDLRGLYRYPDLQCRLLRRTAVRYDLSRPVHETLVAGTVTGRLQNPLWHLTHRDLDSILDKLQRYSAFDAQMLVERGRRPYSGPMLLLTFVRELAAHLFLRGGLTGGPEGVIESVLLSHYRFLIRARLWEMTRTPSLAEEYLRIEHEVSSA
ncbi:MAG: glycosyltransferase family 2 protein [Candidatus Dormibacteria bacterium]